MAERKATPKKKAATRREPSRAQLVREGKKLAEAAERVLNLAGAVKAEPKDSGKKPSSKAKSTPRKSSTSSRSRKG